MHLTCYSVEESGLLVFKRLIPGSRRRSGIFTASFDVVVLRIESRTVVAGYLSCYPHGKFEPRLEKA